jgi:hypothetical protein
VINDDLRAAVAALDLTGRERVWTSLTYCVLDAVWSIGAHYDRVVVPLVRRVAELHGDASPTCPPEDAPTHDPFPLDAFLASYPDEERLRAATNSQRTSTRNGILKADAARRYAQILESTGISTRVQAAAVHGDAGKLDALNSKFRRVPGDGVRRDYFWMLVGSDELVKPDRMVLRFLARHGVPVGVEAARDVLAELARDLSSTRGLPVTPWMVDHAIWRAERAGRTAAASSTDGTA